MPKNIKSVCGNDKDKVTFIHLIRKWPEKKATNRLNQILLSAFLTVRQTCKKKQKSINRSQFAKAWLALAICKRNLLSLLIINSLQVQIVMCNLQFVIYNCNLNNNQRMLLLTCIKC